MSRLVQAKPKNAMYFNASRNSSTRDYLERVAKYVPAEIISVYIVSIGIAENMEGNKKFWVLMITFLACAIFTPVYFGLMAQSGEPKSIHQVVSFVAFLIWAYSISGNDGIFGPIGWNCYDGGIAAIIILLFSLISGVIVPSGSSQKLSPNSSPMNINKNIND